MNNVISLTFTVSDIRRMSSEPELSDEVANKVLRILRKKMTQATAELTTPSFTVTFFNF